MSLGYGRRSGPDAIVGSRNGYALEGATTDALVFEDLLAEARAARRAGDARTAADVAARALSLWCGCALDGLADTDAVRAEADRLAELRTDALEERFEAALELGEHREIISQLQQAIREHPFRERLWRQLNARALPQRARGRRARGVSVGSARARRAGSAWSPGRRSV